MTNTLRTSFLLAILSLLTTAAHASEGPAAAASSNPWVSEMNAISTPDDWKKQLETTIQEAARGTGMISRFYETSALSLIKKYMPLDPIVVLKEEDFPTLRLFVREATKAAGLEDDVIILFSTTRDTAMVGAISIPEIFSRPFLFISRGYFDHIVFNGFPTPMAAKATIFHEIGHIYHQHSSLKYQAKLFAWASFGLALASLGAYWLCQGLWGSPHLAAAGTVLTPTAALGCERTLREALQEREFEADLFAAKHLGKGALREAFEDQRRRACTSRSVHDKDDGFLCSHPSRARRLARIEANPDLPK